MIIKHMTKSDAKIICDWKYQNEYSVYNVGGWKFAKKTNGQFQNLKLENNNLEPFLMKIKKLLDILDSKNKLKKLHLV